MEKDSFKTTERMELGWYAHVLVCFTTVFFAPRHSVIRCTLTRAP